jgi:APA family basic amino acid/polyamine antiporter
MEKTRHMSTSPLPREMGFGGAFALVVNLQLGSAMFLLPRPLSEYGVWGVLSWLVTGCGAMALCHIFSALAIYKPMVGGPHVYIRAAFGKRWGFYAGWTYWVAAWLSSIPLILLGTSALEHMVGDLGGFGRLAVQMGGLWALMGLNIRGTQLSGIGEVVFSVLKVLPLMAIPLFGLYFFDVKILNEPVAMPAFSALSAASLLTFWGFVGLEAGTTVADCVKNPGKTIPRALFLGTFLVMALYFINTLSIFGIVPRAILSQSPNAYAALFQHTLGAGWDKFIQGLVFVMCFGSLNSWLLASGQVALTAANSGLFPSFFNKINGKNSPVMGIKITTLCLMACILLLRSQSFAQQIDTLITLSVTLLIMIYVVIAAALIKFMHKKNIARSPLLLVSLTISIVFCTWTLVTTSPKIILGSLLIPASGYVLARLLRWPVW